MGPGRRCSRSSYGRLCTRDWSELAGCRLAGLGVKSAAVLAMVQKCLPPPSDLAVLWPLLSTLLLPLALFGEEEGSTQWSRLHSHSLALGWPWKEEAKSVPCNTA